MPTAQKLLLFQTLPYFVLKAYSLYVSVNMISLYFCLFPLSQCIMSGIHDSYFNYSELQTKNTFFLPYDILDEINNKIYSYRS